MCLPCEVWLSDFKQNFEDFDKTNFEKPQNMILINLLGVHGKASNLAVLYEIGAFWWLLNHIQ